MQDEERQAPAEGVDAPSEKTAGDEFLESPGNKYERIMMAAAEASRLNEEMRRKGVKLDRKVTIEALKRVDEGRVKAVLSNAEIESRARAALAAERPPETFFMSPPLLAESETEGEEEPGKESEDHGGEESE
ncbi:MAG: hypothetical protein V1774_09420 [Candidatus Eisenbacteria bacterium]